VFAADPTNLSAPSNPGEGLCRLELCLGSTTREQGGFFGSFFLERLRDLSGR